MPATPVWTWGRDKHAGFVLRRMAHETAVHRLDAERTAGREHTIDAELAADGIDEFLFEFLMWVDPNAGALAGSVHLHCTDVAGEWLVGDDGHGGYDVTRAHAKGDAAVRGPAADLLLSCGADSRSMPSTSIGDRATAERLDRPHQPVRVRAAPRCPRGGERREQRGAAGGRGSIAAAPPRAGEQPALVGDVVGDGGGRRAGGRWSVSTTSRLRRSPGSSPSRDVPGGLEAVEAIGHAGGRQHQRAGQGGRGHHVGRAGRVRSAARTSNSPVREPVGREDGVDRAAGEGGEPPKPPDRAHRRQLGVEVGALAPPLLEELVDTVGHGRHILLRHRTS